MEFKFEIKENGKPFTKAIKKENKKFFGCSFDRTRTTFHCKESDIVISETKVNTSLKNYPRKFVIALHNVGEGKELNMIRSAQIDLEYNDLQQLKNNINKILEYDTKKRNYNFNHKTAGEIFNKNINNKIEAEVMINNKKEEATYFNGRLISIVCNQFFIETEQGNIEMFRYENLISLKIINE